MSELYFGVEPWLELTMVVEVLQFPPSFHSNTATLKATNMVISPDFLI